MSDVKRRNITRRTVLIFLLIIFPLIFLVSIAFFSVTRVPFLTPGGHFENIATVTLRPEAGSTVFYTLDGKAPNENSKSTTEELTLRLYETTTINAYAIHPGKFKSSLTSQTYEIKVLPYRPVLSQESGTYKGALFVYANCAEKDGIDIHYTMDGSDPSDTSPVFSEDKPLVITKSTTLKARSFQGKSPLNEVIAYEYTIQSADKQAAMEELPKSGVYENSVEVPLKGEQGGYVLYTEDGSQPSASSSIARQGEKLKFDHSVKLKMMPVYEAYDPGNVVSMDYTVKNAEPIVKSVKSDDPSAVAIEISVPTPGSLVYYTTNGSDPNDNSNVIEEKKTLRITKTTTIKAVTKADGRLDSKIFSKKYTPPTPPKPTVSESSSPSSQKPSSQTPPKTGSDPPSPKDNGSKVVALTFDDGPGKYTNKLLDGLKKRGVKATFFVIGVNVKRYSKEVKRMVNEGHEVGNHTWNHEKVPKLSDAEYKNVLKKTNDLIESVSGKRPRLFRPPGGSTDKRKIPEGMTRVLWSIDTNDWRHRNEEHLYNYLLSHTKSGSVILMHEIYGTTVDGVLRAIDVLQKRGYKFVTYSQLQEYV